MAYITVLTPYLTQSNYFSIKFCDPANVLTSTFLTKISLHNITAAIRYTNVIYVRCTTHLVGGTKSESPLYM